MGNALTSLRADRRVAYLLRFLFCRSLLTIFAFFRLAMNC
jgi:hypothetical protein